MSGIALEQMGGFQLREGHFYIFFLLTYVHSLFLDDFKLLVYHKISAIGPVLVVKGE